MVDKTNHNIVFSYGEIRHVAGFGWGVFTASNIPFLYTYFSKDQMHMMKDLIYNSMYHKVFIIERENQGG